MEELSTMFLILFCFICAHSRVFAATIPVSDSQSVQAARACDEATNGLNLIIPTLYQLYVNCTDTYL